MSRNSIAFLYLLALAICSTTWAQDILPPESGEPPESLGDLTLADCLGLALEHSPELASFAWEPRKAEARTIQAGLRPNPEINFEIQDIGLSDQGGESSSSSTVTLTPTPALGFGFNRDNTSDSSGGLDSSEITLSVSQLVELGGKRMKRVRLAQDGERVVDVDYEIVRMEVLTSTAKAFYDVLLLQHRHEMAASFAKFAKDAHAITQARVQAGSLAPLEETRSDVELRGIELETEHAEHELDSARVRLVAHWGAMTPKFGKALGSLSIPIQPEDLESFLDRMDQSPDVQRWAAERELRESELLLERATARPNITVTAGLRSTGSTGTGSSNGFGISTIDGASLSRGRGEDDDRELSFLVGVSVPLRLFHRNQGRILEAELAVEQLSDQERAHRVQIHSAINAEWQALAATYAEAKTLEEEILPKAQQVFDLTQEGYRQGKFGLTDVLLSQRALFDSKKELLETFRRHYAAKVEMERFTGQSVRADSGVVGPLEDATR